MMCLCKNSHHFIQPISPKNSIKFLSRFQLREGSTILVYPNELKFYQYLHVSKSYLYTKIQLISLIHLSTASKSSFWTKFCIVKEVYSNKVQMTSNFARTYSFLPYSSMARIQLYPFSHFSRNLHLSFCPETVLTSLDQPRSFLASPMTHLVHLSSGAPV